MRTKNHDGSAHMFRIHTLYIHYTHTIHMLHIHYTYAIHTIYIHYTYTIHTLYIHYTYTIHTLYIHYTYTIHPREILEADPSPFLLLLLCHIFYININFNFSVFFKARTLSKTSLQDLLKFDWKQNQNNKNWLSILIYITRKVSRPPASQFSSTCGGLVAFSHRESPTGPL